jgi:hypothetical protein
MENGQKVVKKLASFLCVGVRAKIMPVPKSPESRESRKKQAPESREPESCKSRAHSRESCVLIYPRIVETVVKVAEKEKVASVIRSRAL